MSELIDKQVAIAEVEWAMSESISIARDDWRAIVEALKEVPPAQTEIIRCRDCKYFEYDHPYVIQGVPVLGHEVCSAWGDGCKTDENGYCFLAERRTDDRLE